MTVNARRLATDLSCRSIDKSGNFALVGSQLLFEGRLTLIGRMARMKDALRLRC